MKMFKVNLCSAFFIICFSFLISCGAKIEIINGVEIKTERMERVKISGVAEEDKGGAIVFTESNSSYTVGKLKGWKKKFLNKKVVVSGRLVVVTYSQLDSSRIMQSVRRKQLLKRPIYKLNE